MKTVGWLKEVLKSIPDEAELNVLNEVYCPSCGSFCQHEDKVTDIAYASKHSECVIIGQEILVPEDQILS